jgi:hypothetical protein
MSKKAYTPHRKLATKVSDTNLKEYKRSANQKAIEEQRPEPNEDAYLDDEYEQNLAEEMYEYGFHLETED